MKALTIYTLQNTIEDITPDMLEVSLFQPIKREEEITYRLGFVPNIEGELISTLAGNTCIRLAAQKKVVNKSQFKKELAIKELTFEQDMGRTLNKKELNEAKAQVTESLLIKTEPDDEPKFIDLLITKCGKVLVGTTTKVAEECLALLRQCISTLPVIPLQVNTEPCARMTDMVLEELNEVITLSNKVMLVTSEERKVSITNGETRGCEAIDLIKDGAFVTSLALEYDAVVKFLLKEDLTLSSIKLDKSITEEVEDEDSIGSFILTTTELVKCVDEIIKEFGGLTSEGV
jgi:recombination associated protein RdgC